MFGPKHNDQWAAGIVLNGNDGANGSNGSNGTPGKNGNTILSGQGLPTSAAGQVGDFYLDLSKMDFYGPKTSSSWGTPISLKPANSLSKRILLKEDIGFTLCQSCYTYETDWLPGYSTFSVTTPEVFFNVGDISEYYTKGQVIYEARVNGREWIPMDQAGKKEIQYNYSINGRAYDILFIPAAIQYYNRSQLSFPTHSMISVRGIQSMQNLINYMKAEAKIDVKITLVPKETIEVISKAYPDQKVDIKFISKYLSVER